MFGRARCEHTGMSEAPSPLIVSDPWSWTVPTAGGLDLARSLSHALKPEMPGIEPRAKGSVSLDSAAALNHQW